MSNAQHSDGTYTLVRRASETAVRVRRDAFVLLPAAAGGVFASRPVAAPFGAHVSVETFRSLCALIDAEFSSIFGCLAVDAAPPSSSAAAPPPPAALSVLDVPAVLARIVSLLLVLRVNVHLLVASGEAGAYIGALVSEAAGTAPPLLRRRHPGPMMDEECGGGGGSHGGGSPLLFQELKGALLRLALIRGDGPLAAGVCSVRRLAVGCLSAGMDVFFSSPESQLEILRECVFGDAGLDPAAASAAAAVSSFRSVFDPDDSDDGSDGEGLGVHGGGGASSGAGAGPRSTPGYGRASTERSEFYSEIILHFTSSPSAARTLFDRLSAPPAAEGDVGALMFGLLSLSERSTRCALEGLRSDAAAAAQDEEKKAEGDATAAEAGGGGAGGPKLGYGIDLLLMFQRELLLRAFAADGGGAPLHGPLLGYASQLLKAAGAAVELGSGLVASAPRLAGAVERALEGSFVGLALPSVAAALAMPAGPHAAATAAGDGADDGAGATPLPLFALLGLSRNAVGVTRAIMRLVQQLPPRHDGSHQPSSVRVVRVSESAHPWR